MAETIEELIEAVRREGRREEFPVDTQIYRQFQKDPSRPILYAGSLTAPVCVFARDLGKDEVKCGQPLIGAGGRLVRAGLLRAWLPDETNLERALELALLTNTVPFKPPGNKAYSDPVKERFRPFLIRLLAHHWQGKQVITLGTEAFRWFEPHGDPEEFRTLGTTDARFQSVFHCRIPLLADGSSKPKVKPLLVRPLPHPSPLNRRWYSRFPSLLDQRLREVRQELAQCHNP